MSDRDELKVLIESIGPSGRLADAILAAGYRKQRVITTAEELDALPENAVIRDSEPATLQLMDGAWRIPGSNAAWTADYIEFPATVLHEGTQP